MRRGSFGPCVAKGAEGGPLAVERRLLKDIAVMALYSVVVDDLRTLIDPLSGVMWKCDPITVEEVKQVAEDEHIYSSWQDINGIMPPHLHRPFHVMRIATLVTLGQVNDDQYPIRLIISDIEIYFYDGNHRFAASIVRCDNAISIEIIDASADGGQISRLLPNAVEIT